MADNGRVHPDCVNASNPYHECGVACLERIAQGHGQKEKKKSGSILETTLSFGRKKKGSESQPRSPRVVNNVPAAKAMYPSDNLTPRSPLPPRRKVESESGQSSSSSRQHSDESYSHDHSLDKAQIKSSEILPTFGNLTPNGSKSFPLGSFTCFAIAPPEDNEKLDTLGETAPHEKFDALGETVSSPPAKSPINGPLNFTFSGISRASEDGDDEEVQSVISDSCVSVGKYHVRANTASILQSIIDKYGDIAANCKLESTSLRAYYLECLCSVVHELQSTSFNQLTKSKVKELLAVLKDVESAQIDVSWLQSILNGLTEAVELNNQQQAAEEANAKCNLTIESTKKELETMMEDLAQKEKAVADTRVRIDETRACLSKLELESSQLNETISLLSLKVEKFHSKPMADQIL